MTAQSASFHVLKLTLLLLTAANVLLTVSLFTSDDLNSNPFLKQYDKINYDTAHLDHKHKRHQRSIDPFIYFTFSGYGRQFNLKLHESAQNSFNTKHLVESPSGKHSVQNLINFYEGTLLDEPFTSHVSGTIINGCFYGTIESDTEGKYFIESSRKYNHTLQDAHSIIYHEDDIDLSTIEKLKKENNKHKRSVDSNDSDDYLSCGASKKSVEEEMQAEQTRLFGTRGFDPYSYIDPDKYHLFDDWQHETNKYTREAQASANHRDKRATGSKDAKSMKASRDDPQRVYFPDKRTMCDMYLRVDPQLYTEIFNSEGNFEHAKTVSFILFYLNKHVEALNNVYNGLKFFDPDQARYYLGVQFLIYRTKIITQDECEKRANLTEEELKLCVPFLDVSAFLNYVSLDNFDDYCLSYTFTARDFTDGTLGLAWVAKLTGSVGGVCERRQTLQGVAKSLNSGIVTIVNYKSRVPEAVSQITFAHEVGHNFGSEHDPDDSQCSPGANKGGNYIMYRRATTGTDRNNRNFSQCSKDQMGPIIHSLVQNPIKFCFKEYNGSLCGNGIVESGEECDCGYANECKEKDCCHDADSNPSVRCRLKKGAKCSPSVGPCCSGKCEFAPASTVCMLNNECLNNVTCTGQHAFCPRNSSAFFKPGLTPCNSGTQVCREGECVGSICEAHGMVQCYLQGNLKDKKQDKAILCHLACIGEKTGNVCMDSFQIKGMGSNTSGLILKPGSPCIGTLGYCDIFSKCRPVDGEGPLSRLKNLLLNPVTLSAIREWVTRYWWAVMLMTAGVLVFMVAFIKVCSVHTPSSNPRKPPALKISDTLRRPIKHYQKKQSYHVREDEGYSGDFIELPKGFRSAAEEEQAERRPLKPVADHKQFNLTNEHIPHPHLHMPHMPHLHLGRSTPSAPPAEPGTSNQSRPSRSTSNNKEHVVNEKFSKNQKISARSSRHSGVAANGHISGQSASNGQKNSSKSKSPSSTKHPKGHVPHNSHPNHITDKSHRSKSTNPSKLANMFTIKKRHKTMEPINMQNMAAKPSSSRQSSSRSETRSVSADPKHQGNKNVENLPPLPEVVIKNVKRSSKATSVAASSNPKASVKK